LKNSIFGHKKTSNFGHEKPAVIQNLSLAITVEELPRRQWSVAERLLGIDRKIELILDRQVKLIHL